jgi:hypothetical protein
MKGESHDAEKAGQVLETLGDAGLKFFGAAFNHLQGQAKR